MTLNQHHDEGPDAAPEWPRLLWRIIAADPHPGYGTEDGGAADGGGDRADPPRLVVRRPTRAEVEAWAVRHRDWFSRVDLPPPAESTEQP